MIERDFVLRQIHQLVQVLQAVLFYRRTQEHDRAQEALAEGLAQALGTELVLVRGLAREEVLALCTAGGVFSGEKAVAVADLLREDRTSAGRQRALWLYEAALTAGSAVPFDVHERIAALRASLE